MSHLAPMVPGPVQSATKKLRVGYPTLCKEAHQTFTDPDFFEKPAYGASYQAIAKMSVRGRVELLEMILALVEDIELEELSTDMLGSMMVVLQTTGALSPTQLGRLTDISPNLIRGVRINNPSIPSRLAGKIPVEQLQPIQDVLKYRLVSGNWCQATLRNIRDAGVSITVLSRLVGLSAHRLGRWFRLLPADAPVIMTEVEVDFLEEEVTTTDPEPAPVETKENHSEDRTDGGVPSEAGASAPGSLPVDKLSHQHFDVPDFTGDDDPRIHGNRPLILIRDGLPKLSYWGIQHYSAAHKARNAEVAAGKAGHSDVADQSVQAG